MNKRKDPRFRTRFDALYASGHDEGSGVLVDLSYSGARLEGTTMTPLSGTKVRLYVFIQPVQPFELVGHVVRHTEDGFAIEVDISDAEVQRLVDDVGAIVRAPV